MRKRDDKLFRITVNLNEEIYLELEKLSEGVKKEVILREALELHMNYKNTNIPEKVEYILYDLHELLLLIEIILKNNFPIADAGLLRITFDLLENVKYTLIEIKKEYSLTY